MKVNTCVYVGPTEEKEKMLKSNNFLCVSVAVFYVLIVYRSTFRADYVSKSVQIDNVFGSFKLHKDSIAFTLGSQIH